MENNQHAAIVLYMHEKKGDVLCSDWVLLESRAINYCFHNGFKYFLGILLWSTCLNAQGDIFCHVQFTIIKKMRKKASNLLSKKMLILLNYLLID